MSYSIDYLDFVVESQGRLFDIVSEEYPTKDTEDFIESYMKSYTRKCIDNSQAYVNTMSGRELLAYFIETEHYEFKDGKVMKGFMPRWIGEFYAYYQWYYDIPSSEVIKEVPLDFLKKAYYGLHDLTLKLAVEKVGKNRTN